MIMIGAGLLAFLVNIALLQSGDDQIDVLVLTNDVSAGDRLRAADVGTASIDADSPFRDRTVTPDEGQDLPGFIVTRDIDAGSPLLEDDFRPNAAPGAHRAMSISLPPSRAVAGDIIQGDRVDVISVEDGTATYIATGIEVLIAAEVEENRLAASGDYSVTVAVDDATALAIARALQVGEVHVIRSTGAAEVAPIDEANDG